MIEKFEDEAYEKEGDQEQKTIQIKSNKWKDILDKNKRDEAKETENNNEGGGFFLNFDDAPRTENVEKKQRISIPTKQSPEEIERQMEKAKMAEERRLAKLEK